MIGGAFRPVWWARGGLAQTIAGRRPGGDVPALCREVWTTPDDDELRVFFGEPPGAAATLPIVLLLHGLEGSHRSPYVAEVARGVFAHGWRFAMFEYRSCGGVLNRARRTYHSGETGDLAWVVAQLLARWPMAPICMVGVSLGGNVLLKWLGECGETAPTALVAAAAISPPFDLAVSAAQCDRRYGGAIARYFLKSMVGTALAKERQYPGLCDPAAVRRCRTFAAFDELFTAPLHGFASAQDYWRTQSCGQFLPAIRVPTLLVAAADDPLSRADVLPHRAVAASRFLTAALPERGGHVGFVDGGSPWRPRHWAERQVLADFAQRLGAPRQ